MAWRQFAFDKFCYHKLVLIFVFAEGLAKKPCSHRTLKNIVRFLVIFKDNWLVNLLVKKKTLDCSIHFLSIVLRSRFDYQQLFGRGDRTDSTLFITIVAPFDVSDAFVAD